MRRPRYTQERVIQAIRDHQGLLTLAADELACNRNTLTNYCQRYPTVQRALQDARERRLDAAERRLFSAVDEGDLHAIMFYLRTIGRQRGYGDHLEVDATVDVLQTPEWLRTRALLLDALRPYPDAQRALVTRLRALQPPSADDVDGDGAEDAG